MPKKPLHGTYSPPTSIASRAWACAAGVGILIASERGACHKRGVDAGRVVLFDFDGILVDTEWAIYQSWCRCFAAEGQDLPLSLYTRCIGSDFATWSPKTHLEELTGKTFDWVAMDKVRQREIVHELKDEGLMEGVMELIAALQERKLPLGVVSSSSHHWVDGWLEQLGIAGHFAHVVCRGDAPRIKPQPDLWLEAARRFEVKPWECLAIEDSHNGLVSAMAAGMPVWVVPNRVTAALDFSAAQARYVSLREIAQQLRVRADGGRRSR
jgi:HAD superfamily hydrolase (TIGR01509 family)